MKLKTLLRICRFMKSLMYETVHTQCLVRELRDEVRSSKAPSVSEKQYLSVAEAATWIDCTPNLIKSLIKNQDITAYISPYKGYYWVSRRELEQLIEFNKVESSNTRRSIAAESIKRRYQQADKKKNKRK